MSPLRLVSAELEDVREFSPTPPTEALFGPEFQNNSSRSQNNSTVLQFICLSSSSGKALLEFSFINDRILRKCF